MALEKFLGRYLQQFKRDIFYPAQIFKTQKRLILIHGRPWDRKNSGQLCLLCNKKLITRVKYNSSRARKQDHIT